MRGRLLLIFLLTILIAPLCVAQTDVAASVTGAFTADSSSTSIAQSTSPVAGEVLEVRHIFGPLRGFEAAYSYRHASSHFTYVGARPAAECSPGPGCIVYPNDLYAASNVSQLTADWTPSLHRGSLRPFAILGAGVLFDLPTGNRPYITRSIVTQPVGVFGAGADWQHWHRFGLRAQYRGNVYQAPNMTTLFEEDSNRAPTLTSDAALGVYFRLP